MGKQLRSTPELEDLMRIGISEETRPEVMAENREIARRMRAPKCVIRLQVPSTIGYTIRQLSEHAGVEFGDRQIVDVPLQTEQQIEAARKLESQFASGLSGQLRNGPNAVTVYSCEVICLG